MISANVGAFCSFGLAACAVLNFVRVRSRFYGIKFSHIRKATIQDENQVLTISNGVYEGWDYLPYIFRNWLSDRRRIMYVAIDRKNRVQGLITLSTFDAGECVMFQALRVGRLYQRQGVANRLSEFAQDQPEALNAKRWCITTKFPAHHHSIRLHEKQGYSKDFFLGMAGFNLEESSRIALRVPDRWPRPRKVSAKDLTALLVASCLKLHKMHKDGSLDLSWLGLHQGVLFVDWVCYSGSTQELLGENLAILEAQGHEFWIDMRPNSSNIVNSLSIGGQKQVVKGTFWYCTIYCTGHEESFLAHLTANTLRAHMCRSIHGLICTLDPSLKHPDGDYSNYDTCNLSDDPPPVFRTWMRHYPCIFDSFWDRAVVMTKMKNATNAQNLNGCGGDGDGKC